MYRIASLGGTVVLILLFGIGAQPQAALSVTANTTQSIAIPSYFYPGSLWTQMEQAHPPVQLAIINPHSGPGNASKQDYINQVQHSRSAGLLVLGYVHTSWGTRSADEVRAEIDEYYSWYHVNGIFFDEASTDCAKVTPYYGPLNNYVKAKDSQALTVINPGTATNECYMSAADVVVTFEGSYSKYRSGYSAPSWMASYPTSRFWHLIYATSTNKKMRKAIELSKQRGAGWVYVTPDGGANPWDTLPAGSYWKRELSAVG